jgi:hypothetical protein
VGAAVEAGEDFGRLTGSCCPKSRRHDAAPQGSSGRCSREFENLRAQGEYFVERRYVRCDTFPHRALCEAVGDRQEGDAMQRRKWILGTAAGEGIYWAGKSCQTAAALGINTSSETLLRADEAIE